MLTPLPLGTRRFPETRIYRGEQPRRKLHFPGLAAFAILILTLASVKVIAQVNGLGAKPYLGWSTYSQETLVPSSTVMNEQNILAQSNAMRSSGLEAHGFRYINLDAGWSGNNDQYGRTLWNTTAFPHFLDMIQHIHANGQKVGIYLLPGIGTSIVSANLPIFGTQYHAQDIVAMPLTIGNGFGYGYKIDFTKPGAQEYINSIVNLYASWGIDFIKLDGVTPGSYNDNLNIDNIPDVQAYSQAIAQSGRDR